MSFYSSKLPSDEDRWVCIYPIFLNAKRTIAQGRRVNKEKAVDLPTAQEIYDIVSNAGMKAKIEKLKMHPLDPNRDPSAQGRVRVQLRNEDGTLFNEKFPNRLSLMYYICEMIPKLKTRQSGTQLTTQVINTGGGKANKKKKR